MQQSWRYYDAFEESIVGAQRFSPKDDADGSDGDDEVLVVVLLSTFVEPCASVHRNKIEVQGSSGHLCVAADQETLDSVSVSDHSLVVLFLQFLLE